MANLVCSNWTKIEKEISIFIASIPKIFFEYNPQLLNKYAHHIHSNVTLPQDNPNGLILNICIFNDHFSSHAYSVGVLVSGGLIKRTMNQESNTGVFLLTRRRNCKKM